MGENGADYPKGHYVAADSVAAAPSSPSEQVSPNYGKLAGVTTHTSSYTSAYLLVKNTTQQTTTNRHNRPTKLA